MKIRRHMVVALLVFGVTVATARERKNLIENGRFDDPDDPMRGWIVDYAWAGNIHYMDNVNKVSVAPRDAGRTSVLQIESTSSAGTKVESPVVPFDINQRYRATLYVRGGPCRIQFRGYHWKPGVRPHDDPQPEELREVYRSKAEAGGFPSWQQVSIEIPGTDASELSLRHLKRVRFIRLFALFVGSGAIDDVVIRRVR